VEWFNAVCHEIELCPSDGPSQSQDLAPKIFHPEGVTCVSALQMSMPGMVINNGERNIARFVLPVHPAPGKMMGSVW
jgi:hypothetical protein